MDWAHLSFAGCTHLRAVTLRLAISPIVWPDPPYWVLFGAVADIVARLPPRLETITFELIFLYDGPAAIATSTGCIPWRQIDRHLEDRTSTAVVEVKPSSMHRCLGQRGIAIVKDIVSRRMVYTLSHEQLRFMYTADD